jgi:hypothetical protein
MSELKVNSKVFQYPDQGKEPNWGRDASKWAKEVTDVLNGFFGLGTITETQSTIENNISSINAKPVPGLQFNQALTRSAEIKYRIYRKTNLTSESAEEGTLHVVYSEADPLNKWSVSRVITSGEPTMVYFDIDNNGQIKYHSNNKLLNISDTNYVGYVKFKTSSTIK